MLWTVTRELLNALPFLCMLLLHSLTPMHYLQTGSKGLWTGYQGYNTADILTLVDKKNCRFRVLLGLITYKRYPTYRVGLWLVGLPMVKRGPIHKHQMLVSRRCLTSHYTLYSFGSIQKKLKNSV
jgi:hypothetical protein